MTEQLSADELNAKCIDLAYRVGRLQGRVDVWNSDVERTLEEMNASSLTKLQVDTTRVE